MFSPWLAITVLYCTILHVLPYSYTGNQLSVCVRTLRVPRYTQTVWMHCTQYTMYMYRHVLHTQLRQRPKPSFQIYFTWKPMPSLMVALR